MTDEQAAKVPSLRTQLLAAAREFSLYLPEPLEPEDCDELMHILEPVVTSLTAARERAVWLEAAEAYERYVQSRIPKAGDWKPPQPFAAWCRQQANKEQTRKDSHE